MGSIDISDGSDGSQGPSSKKSLKHAIKHKAKNLNRSSFKFVIAAVLLLLVGAGFANQARVNSDLKKENARLSNPQEAAKDEAEQLKAEVAKLIDLPNETPTIATVVDVEKLKSQAFFTKAQNGDKVLMFSEAKKAVLYRPSTKKIIEVAPINLGSGNTQGTSTEVTTPAPAASTKKSTR